MLENYRCVGVSQDFGFKIQKILRTRQLWDVRQQASRSLQLATGIGNGLEGWRNNTGFSHYTDLNISMIYMHIMGAFFASFINCFWLSFWSLTLCCSGVSCDSPLLPILFLPWLFFSWCRSARLWWIKNGFVFIPPPSYSYLFCPFCSSCLSCPSCPLNPLAFHP